MVLTKFQVINKYSKGYLSTLENNLWVQGYLGKKRSWDETYNNLVLPDLAYLWRITELVTPGAITLTKENGKNRYIASAPKGETQGECPEEALLKLFVLLEI